MITPRSTIYGTSSLKDGNMKYIGGLPKNIIFRNRNLFLEKLSLPVSGLITVNQTHSDKVYIFDQTEKENSSVCSADAIITNKPGFALGILTADCIPIVLFDKNSKGVGVIHAGRAGSFKNITYKVVTRFIELIGVPPENIVSFIGPGIGICCYEVEKEMSYPLTVKYKNLNFIKESKKKGKCNLDLKSVNKNQLIEACIPEKNIIVSSKCTCCSNEYFSYRRNKTNKRMITVAAITN